MNFRLFFAIMTLTTIHQSFSMIPDEQQNLNWQLRQATIQNNNNEVASLLQAGADTAVKDWNGSTPLHWAASDGHTAIVVLLLSQGADINATNNNGHTPLHWAAFNGHTAIVKLLLSKGSDINAKSNIYRYTPLHRAAGNGHIPTAELLITKGADINAKDYYGETPLHGAVWNGHTAIVELLLSHGADINAKDKYGYTPLQHAAWKGHREIIELLKCYSILFEQDKKPTPKQLLRVTIEHGYFDLVKLLLQRGLKPDVTDLQLAKAKWHTAEHKQSYEAIGRMLIQRLSLLPNVGPVSKSGIVDLYGLPADIAEEIAKHL